MANFIKIKAEQDKKHKKDLSDTSINMRFKENDMRQDTPEVITEKQLTEGRVEEKTVIMEKLLESVRKGSADSVTERQLDTTKSELGSKFRNSKAYEGDINKLEEKRLAGDKNEDEKYKPSSEISKKMRWWENLKPIKTEKVASTDKTVKTAGPDEDPEEDTDEDPAARALRELDFSERARGRRLNTNFEEDAADPFEIPDDDMGFDDETSRGEGPDDVEEAEETEAETDLDTSKLFLGKNVRTDAPVKTLFLQFSYNDKDLSTDEAAATALKKTLEIYPFLEGQVGTEDFTIQRSKVKGHSDILLRLTGFDDTAEVKITNPFSDIVIDTKTIGGTKHYVGFVKLNPAVTIDFSDSDYVDELLASAADYIGQKKRIDVPVQSLTLDKKNKTIKFMYAPSDVVETEETPAEAEAEVAPETEEVAPAAEPTVTDITPATPVEEKFPVTSKSEYDFPIVVADTKDINLKKK